MRAKLMNKVIARTSCNFFSRIRVIEKGSKVGFGSTWRSQAESNMSNYPEFQILDCIYKSSEI